MTANPYAPPQNAPNQASPESVSPSRQSAAIAVIRSILGVFAGVVAALVVVLILESIGHLIYPPPPGIDLSKPEQLREIISRLPIGALISVLVAWAAGSFVGGFTAAAVAGRAHVVHALMIGGLQMAAGIVTMLMIPHPLWFAAAAVVLIVPSAWLGAVLAKRIGGKTPPGPQTYDMRKKNMAC